MKNILDQFHLLAHTFFLHVFVVANSYCCFVSKRIKKKKIIFFYAKVFQFGYVLIFSSVKISIYRYYKTNKTLSFIYHCLHAHRISPPQKELFNY